MRHIKKSKKMLGIAGIGLMPVLAFAQSAISGIQEELYS